MGKHIKIHTGVYIMCREMENRKQNMLLKAIGI
jgi:hypothetical protein